LGEKFASVVVSPVYLTDHRRLYQNPRLHPIAPALKAHCFTPRKLQSDAVPESTDFGLESAGASQTVMSAKRGWGLGLANRCAQSLPLALRVYVRTGSSLRDLNHFVHLAQRWSAGLSWVAPTGLWILEHFVPLDCPKASSHAHSVDCAQNFKARLSCTSLGDVALVITPRGEPLVQDRLG
jgi:hypothetical protein